VGRDSAVNMMKQNEKIDERFEIKASNLQSTNCMEVSLTDWTPSD
jgi:hypothetical protein